MFFINLSVFLDKKGVISLCYHVLKRSSKGGKSALDSGIGFKKGTYIRL
jgi:hypothetical protein